MESASPFILSAILLSSIAVHAQDQSKIELGFGDWLLDVFVGDRLGGQEASPDIQEYVRTMLKEAHVPDADSVRIRKIAKKEFLEVLGDNFLRSYQEATSCDVLFLPKYLYVNEQAFRKLPENQRRFLIGREIMHLKSRLDVWNSLLAIIFLMSTVSFKKVNLFGLTINNAEFKPSVVRFFILRSIQKCLECTSDFAAVQEFNALEGGIDLMNNWVEYEKEREKELPQWKFNRYLRFIGRRVVNFLSGSHLLPEYRLKWLESLRAK